MKLIMIMCTRDNADVIAQNLRFHLERGVSEVIVLDNGSVDGTRDILADFDRSAPVTVLDDASRDFAQDRLMTQLAHRARDSHGADWILPNDADEFWLPHTGDLPHSICADATADVSILECTRRNLFAPWDGPETAPWHERLIYRVADPEPIPALNDLITDPRPCPHFYCDLKGKVMLRAQGLQRISMGSHTAFYETDPLRRKSDIVVYHVPIRSRAQFEAKARDGGAALARNKELPISAGWHLRRWDWQMRTLGFDAAIEDAIPSSSRLAADQKTGIVLQDKGLCALIGNSG
ncbi:MAG: glycosyltransferase family 2 protein [Pseudomonadota bacterium]